MASELDRTVQAALVDLTKSKYPSLRAAAAAYSLNYTTLANRRREGLNRRREGLNRRESHSNQQILSPEQEDRLIQWILNLERQGYAPAHKQVRDMAQKISISSGGSSTLRINWIKRFLQRHSSISTKIRRRKDALRIQNTNPTNLRAWYNAFHALVRAKSVDPEDIWNMDETGFTLSQYSTNERVIRSSGTKRTYKKAPDASREWVTIVKAISATDGLLTARGLNSDNWRKRARQIARQISRRSH
jgi:Tc5 transposase DNA-binding domain